MKKACIITYYRYPNGDAGSVRQHSFAKILIALGYEVYVIGMGSYTGNQILKYDNVSYTSFRNAGSSIVCKFHNFLGYSCKLRRFLNAHGKFDLLLVIDLPLAAMKGAEKYAKENECILIHDSVEWYSPEEFRLKWFSPEYFRKDLKNRFFFKKPWRIIGISTFLSDHYRNKGLKTIRIPVILDISNSELKKECPTDKTLIMYAGNPLAKDYFDQIIGAIETIDKEIREKIELQIYGISDSQFQKSFSISNQRWIELKKTVHCMGRVPRETVMDALSKAHYTILIRDPDKRYAKAGFPTKIPESLSTGTPVICNLSSDLGLYLQDEENAIIVRGQSPESIKAALERAVLIPEDKRTEMQKSAFETAKRFFDYNIYTSELGDFINGQ